jgi:hypothetical protein
VLVGVDADLKEAHLAVALLRPCLAMRRRCGRRMAPAGERRQSGA